MANTRKEVLSPFVSLLLFLSFFLCVPAVFAAGFQYNTSREPVRIQADLITYDGENREYIAEGNVEIWQGDTKLTADRVVLKEETRKAEATGHVILVKGSDVLRGSKMTIDLETKLGVIIQGSLFLKQQNYHLRGEEIERLGENTYRIRRGSFTTCDGDNPAWSFGGKESVVTLEEYASIWGATFRVKDIPVFYSPYLVLPVKTKRQSGFLFPRIGYSSTKGFELGNQYFWAISRNMDATFTLDMATRKGFGEGLEYRYIRKRGSEGTFYGYYTREWESYREQRTEQLDRGPDRWETDLQYEEYMSPSFFAKTRLRLFSDRQYFTDYGRTYADQASEQSYSFASLTKNWDRYSAFGEARYTTNLQKDNSDTLQYLPNIHFTGLWQPIFRSPFYFDFDSAYGYFWREEGTNGFRTDLFPRLSLPLRLGPLEFTPEVFGRETFYEVQDGSEGTTSRELWGVQGSLKTEVYRIFETGWARIPKVKHTFRPEITYTYIPHVDQSQIPFYDQPVPKVNEVFYGFTSRLIGKIMEGKGRSRYEELVYLKIGQAFDVNEATSSATDSNEPTGSFGIITGELRIRGLEYVTLDTITTYDPNQNLFLTNYTVLSLADHRGDGLSLDYTWRRGIEEQIYGQIRVRLIPSLEVSYGRRYSVYDNQNLETDYRLLYRHQCWSVEMTYSEIPSIQGNPPENKWLVLFTLMGVGSFGR
jgi:LPS-assembly protein